MYQPIGCYNTLTLYPVKFSEPATVENPRKFKTRVVRFHY